MNLMQFKPIGLTIYGVSRTVLNALRSVEALIMVIVFAIVVSLMDYLSSALRQRTL